MKKRTLYKISIAVGLCFMLLGVNSQAGYAQDDAKSTFTLGKLTLQKKPIPTEGSIKGTIVVLDKKEKVPLAFVDVVGVRSIQADSKGKFDLDLKHGTYKIIVKCSGYKNLVIESFTVKEGHDQYIKINLAIKAKINLQ